VTKQRSKLGAWLQLVRLPNLLTVPGDPIIGFFSWGSIRYFSAADKGYVDIGSVLMVVPCVVAAVLLYAGGLVMNDLFDLNEDRRDRPERPLPAGRINVKVAAIVTVLLLIGGVWAASLNGPLCASIAAMLAVAIASYNAGAKRIPVIGPLNMGLCRGLSVFMGLAISSSLGLGQDTPAALLAWEKLSMLLTWPFYSITPMILYIAAVTHIAASETKTTPMRVRPWLPAGVVAVWMCCVVYPHPARDSVFDWITLGIIACLPVFNALVCGWRLKGSPAPSTVQRTIGVLVGNLLLIQVAVVYFNSTSTNASIEALPLAAALWAGFLCFIWLAKRFYAS
jgi:4-hydroxybenzoate polyprenyltransferase